MESLKIGLALWSLGSTSTEEKLKDALSKAVEIGVSGVQPWIFDSIIDPDKCRGPERKRMRELINSHGLEITGFCNQLIGPKDPGKPWPGSAFADPRDLRQRIERTKKSLELASDMGSPITSLHPGEIPANKSSKTYKLMLESCTELAKHADEVGAIFCIETGQEPAQVLRGLIEDIGSEALKVNYDCANMIRYGVVEGVKTLAPWIVHTHAKDHNPDTGRATLGEGMVPWGPYLKQLKAIGYSGWFAIEDETGKDIMNSLRRGKAFLERKLIENSFAKT